MQTVAFLASENFCRDTVQSLSEETDTQHTVSEVNSIGRAQVEGFLLPLKHMFARAPWMLYGLKGETESSQKVFSSSETQVGLSHKKEF